MEMYLTTYCDSSFIANSFLYRELITFSLKTRYLNYDFLMNKLLSNRSNSYLKHFLLVINMQNILFKTLFHCIICFILSVPLL